MWFVSTQYSRPISFYYKYIFKIPTELTNKTETKTEICGLELEGHSDCGMGTVDPGLQTRIL